MMSRSARALAFILTALAAAAFCTAAVAQVDLRQLEGIGVSHLDPTAAPADLIKVSGYFTPPQSGRSTLYVTADLAPGWHTYSITQRPGGPIRSRVKLPSSSDYKLVGDFRALTRPEEHEYAQIWPGLKIEEHHGRATWAGTLEVAPGIDPSTLEIPAALYAQICAKECLAPQDYKFVARLDNPPDAASAPAYRSANKVVTAQTPPATKSREFRGNQAHVALTGGLADSAVPAGGTTQLSITAQLDADWHIYPLADKDPKQIAKPTLIVVDTPLEFGTAVASKQPISKPSLVTPGTTEQFHDETVTWKIPITVPTNAAPGQYPIRGMIGYQTCRDDVCDLPRAAAFETTLTVGRSVLAHAESLRFTEAKYGEVAVAAERRAAATDPVQQQPAVVTTPAAVTPAADVPPPAVSEPLLAEFNETAVAENVQADYPWVVILLSAFFGGVILNIMPCVLPVIGLKVLSFVEQSHHNRARLLALNLWYAVGVVAVFLALAAFAVVLRNFVGVDFKYGNQHAIQGYVIGMAALMFAMGLSLLGVWEIPIPGFLGSGKVGHISQQEGPIGALAKGAITTLLGASCSGPLVAVAFGFALDRSTPAWATLGTFAVIGLGMASPYLLLGANPQWLRFLPKPGPWMDTFKHVCGFILLAATVWFLTFLKFAYVTPTVAFLIGLWAACWWIGRVPLTEPSTKRLRAWAAAAVFSVLIGLFSFDWLAPAMAEKFESHVNREIADRVQQGAQISIVDPPLNGNQEDSSRLDWQPFTKNLLKQLTRDNKTVMVDFTADWCLNCKALEATVLNTADVKSVVEQNGVVPLVADYTDTPPELTEMLNLLKAGAVPVLAIFPAGDPNNPIVFRGGYTRQTLIDALREAGPSKSVAALRETARQ